MGEHVHEHQLRSSPMISRPAPGSADRAASRRAVTEIGLGANAETAGDRQHVIPTASLAPPVSTPRSPSGQVEVAQCVPDSWKNSRKNAYTTPMNNAAAYTMFSRLPEIGQRAREG